MESDRKGRRTATALEKLDKFNLLTPQGKAWLITATDPFHDSTVDMRGYPDLNVSGSIVQQISKRMTIACPAALNAAPWDLHVVGWPSGATIAGVGGTLYDGYIISTTSPAAAPFSIGGVTALATATGQPTYFNSVAGGATGITNVASIDCSNPGGGSYLDGTCRVIGYGIEVYNTTAPLYRQGDVVVYRMPTPCKESTGVDAVGTVGAGFTSYGNWMCWDLPSPPTTPADALLLRGSKQWNAEDGCYLVCSQNSLNNYADEPDSVEIVVQDAVDDQNNTGLNAVMLNGTRTRVIGSTTITMPTEVQRFPFNLSGAYFTGLSPQTTFTVVASWYIERFPTQRDGDLVVLAQPSAGWDQMALELYAGALRDMPAGVPVSENPLGEWFQDVVHNIAQTASPIANALSAINPGFGVAGQLAGVIAKATERKKEQPSRNNGGIQPVPEVRSPNQSRPKPKKTEKKTGKLGKQKTPSK